MNFIQSALIVPIKLAAGFYFACETFIETNLRFIIICW